MMTQAKLDANRANAQKSTGPKTTEGRANSSRNSFKHGLYSKQLVVGAEEAAALDALKSDLRTEHQPANETEEILVNELGEQFWRLRRARCLEASLLDSETTVLTHLAAIQRMMSSAERGFYKALTALRQLQKDRGFVPANSHPAEPQPSRDCQGAVPAGFVPPNSHSTEPQPSRDCQGAVSVGFVPPACPKGEDIDPADWARAFEARHRVHAKLQS
jgi:hypothetical protein